MNNLNEKEQLVTDLMYLRKGRGLTNGNLANADVVVKFLGGRGEQLRVIRSRLVAAIDLLEDEPSREALKAAYGLLPATEGLPTTADRRGAYGREVGRKPDTLSDRENAAIEELALALMSSPYKVLQTLLPETLSNLRQLYRHSQEALLYLETFEVMAEIVSALRRADAGPIYRLALGCIRNESHFTDLAVWSYAQCQATCALICADHTGAKFLHDGLPTLWWDQRLDRPLQGHFKHQVDAFRVAFGEAHDADDFGRRLRGSSDAEPIERRWRLLLSAEDAGADPEGDQVGEREDLRVRFVALCQFLSRVFPEDTRPADEMAANYGLIVSECLTVVGEYATVRSIPDDTARVEEAVRLAYTYPPERHIFGYRERYVL